MLKCDSFNSSQCFTSLVKEYYEIVDISEGTQLEECNTFLLTECHYDDEITKINGLFISRSATPGSFFLVEGDDYLMSPFRAELARKQFQIATTNIEHVIGWDIENYMELVMSPNCAQEIAMLVDKRRAHLVKWECCLDEMLTEEGIEKMFYRAVLIASSSTQIQWEKEMLELLEANLALEEKKEVRDYVPEFMESARRHIQLLAKKIVVFEEEHLTALEKQLWDVLFLYEDKKNGDFCDTFELKAEAIRLSSQILLKWQERTRFILTATKCELLFQPRNENMLKVLDITRSKINNSESYCYLIAGERHLLQESVDPIYSLQPLHSYMQSHKGIVVLKPKVCVRDSVL